MIKSLSALSLSKPSRQAFSISHWSAVLAIAASFTLFTPPRASAQDPNDSNDQEQDMQQGNQNAPAPSQQFPPQQDRRRVISRDNASQNNQNAQAQQGQYNRNQDQDGDDSAPQQRPQYRNRRQYQPAQNVPTTITIPAGKVIFVRLNERLSSDHSHAGDGFTATLDQPIVVNGWIVARRGETVVGDVTNAQKAGRVKGVSQLGLELSDITIVDGQQLPLVTELWNGSAGTSHGADAAGIATTTGAGTIIGAAASGGEGAAIGAGAGAAAGIAMVLLTRGKPTVVSPETRLSFRLTEDVIISTVNSQQAFLPVGPNDYNSSPSLRRHDGTYAVAYPPYYAACGPYWGCGPYYGYGYYPYYPSFGFAYYGGFGRGFGRGHGFRR
jgi:hypothetical protein